MPLPNVFSPLVSKLVLSEGELVTSVPLPSRGRQFQKLFSSYKSPGAFTVLIPSVLTALSAADLSRANSCPAAFQRENLVGRK